MKKNIYLVLAIIIYFPILSFGQNISFKIQKSEIFKDEIKESQIVISEDDGNGGVLMVRSYNGNGISPNTGYYFEHYDSNLKLIKEFQLETNTPTFQKNKNILGFYFSQSKIFIADILFDLKEKAFVCSMTIVDFNDFKSTKEELFRITKDEIKKLGLFSLTPTYKNNAYDKFINEDKNIGIKMGVNNDKTAFSILMDFNSEDSETFKLLLFDNQMNLKFDKVFKRNIKDSKFEFQNLEVSNDGNIIYLLGKVFTDEKREKNVGGKYQFELTKITKESEKTKVIDVDEHFVKSLKTVVQDEKLISIGFYSDEKDNRYKGICYFELNPDNLELKTKKINHFTDQFIIDKYGESKPKELKDLIFKEILILENKDIVFNAEESYILSNGYGSGGIGGVGGIGGGQTFYNFSDIVSIKLDEKGNLIWARNINKTQTETIENISFISNTSTLINSKVLFFINASEKIKNLDNSRIEFRDTRKNKYNLNLVRVNENGDSDYQKILDDEENEVPFMVANGIKSGNSVFFLGRKGIKKQLLKVSFLD